MGGKEGDTLKTKRRKGPVRVGPRHVEAGTQATGYGGVMRVQDRYQVYGRDPEGRYATSPGVPEYERVGRIYQGFTPSGSYKTSRDWFTDIKVLATIGLVIVAWIISYVVLGTFFEVIVEICSLLGVDSATALSFQPVFQAALGVVVSLIVLGGAIILFFGQNDVDSSDYTKEWD